ncbi:MAG: hypothetical protein D6694_02790 [Gammaproteobacteria bacterium]|nr:MAG: hypothetical protein D6694_02790 [Gammaproteobacteria bacterium]
MSRPSDYKKLVLVFVLLLALVTLFGSEIASTEPSVAPTGTPPDALPYGLPGPHPTGTQDLMIEGKLPLAATIWYPALPQDIPAEETAYPYEIKLGAPLGMVTIASSAGHATSGAPFDFGQGPYPLVILSPGFAIGAASYGWLAEHLASYGFVVMAPDHRERLDPENELWRSAITRPQDVLTLFAYVDSAVGSGGSLAGLIDPETVAVIGHSYGGYTALAAAGAQIDTSGLKSHCENAVQAEDPAVWLCDMLLPHLVEMAALADLDAVPEGLWPDWSDSRVDAVVPMAGDAFFFGRNGLAEIDVPVLAIGGSLDNDTPLSWGTYPTYKHVASPTKAQLILNDAEHMIFTNVCEAVRWYAKWVAGEFCADSFWDRHQAHDLINHVITAFLLAELKQDAHAAAALAPSAVEFPAVSYEAQGY